MLLHSTRETIHSHFCFYTFARAFIHFCYPFPFSFLLLLLLWMARQLLRWESDSALRYSTRLAVAFLLLKLYQHTRQLKISGETRTRQTLDGTHASTHRKKIKITHRLNVVRHLIPAFMKTSQHKVCTVTSRC